ncbi:hypothetical protein FRAHR75_200055 [Frankia sp. Hr75.2]|nr:hypothetical protein FRAHR75_200055 [Frankia sp. Hr75.2]
MPRRRSARIGAGADARPDDTPDTSPITHRRHHLDGRRPRLAQRARGRGRPAARWRGPRRPVGDGTRPPPERTGGLRPVYGGRYHPDLSRAIATESGFLVGRRLRELFIRFTAHRTPPSLPFTVDRDVCVSG